MTVNKWQLMLIAFLSALCLLQLSCRQDMHDQPKYESLEASDFFEDGSASRRPPEGTVARGHLRDDELLYTGKTNGQLAAVLTVNIPELDKVLKPGEFFVKTWSENETIAKEALASGLFVDTGKRLESGFVEAQIWRFSDDVRAEQGID